MKNKKIQCNCGCGKWLWEFDNKKRKRKFISGHNSRVQNPYAKIKIKQICKFCGEVYYRCPSLANRGKNNYCSNNCRRKNAYSWIGGKKNPNWKGGFNGVQNLRWCPEYNEWRKKVFARDKYICQKCKETATRKNYLHAHHKKSWADYPKLRFIVKNGITLCKSCHKEIHKKKNWLGAITSKSL